MGSANSSYFTLQQQENFRQEARSPAHTTKVTCRVGVPVEDAKKAAIVLSLKQPNQSSRMEAARTAGWAHTTRQMATTQSNWLRKQQ